MENVVDFQQFQNSNVCIREETFPHYKHTLKQLSYGKLIQVVFSDVSRGRADQKGTVSRRCLEYIGLCDFQLFGLSQRPAGDVPLPRPVNSLDCAGGNGGKGCLPLNVTEARFCSGFLSLPWNPRKLRPLWVYIPGRSSLLRAGRVLINCREYRNGRTKL